MNGFPTTNRQVRSSAILRRTRPGECHKAFIPLIHAKCIIARSNITELKN